MVVGLDSSCRFPSSALGRHHVRSITLHFTDVVHQAEEQPLRIHFLSATQTKSIQSMRVADIAEHRLNRAESSTVLMATLIRVDLALHPLHISFR